jgi:hypothetical protein
MKMNSAYRGMKYKDIKFTPDYSCINVIEIFHNRLTKPKWLDIKPIAGFLQLSKIMKGEIT